MEADRCKLYRNTSMKLFYARFLPLLLLSIGIVSCTEDADLVPEAGLLDNYYPLETGDVRTYRIDSITYDYDGSLQRIVIDTQQYFLQERVLESTRINETDWLRIGLFRSNTLEGEFELEDYAYELKTAGQLLRMEGNLTFIPLASPLKLFDEWDGTAYFNPAQTQVFVRGEVLSPYENWNYLFLKKWEEYEVLQNAYSDVLQINQRDTLSIEVENGNEIILPEKQLFYFLANEFYAPGKGLIEKEEYNLTSVCASSNVVDFQSFCDSTTIFENAERGYIYRKKLVSFE